MEVRIGSIDDSRQRFLAQVRAPMRKAVEQPMRLVALEDGRPTGEEAATAVLKSTGEHRYTLCVAWPALKPDVAKAADGRRDYARPEVIEQTAWDWMTKSRTVGLFHADGTEGRGTVVESYIYRGPDWRVGDALVKAGDWLVGTVWNEDAWALVKAGLINGMSPQGSALRQPADPSLTFER